MTFQISREQFWKAVQIEESTNCEIGAGYTGVHLDKLFSNPVYFQQMQRLQAVVLKEFQNVLGEWNLGAATDAAIACGQPLLLKRFQTLSPEIQQQLWDALEALSSSEESPAEVSPNVVIRRVLENQLTDEDWSAIAAAAANAIHQQILDRLPLKFA